MSSYQSDELTSSERSVPSPPVKRHRGKAQSWQIVHNCNDAASFKPWMDAKIREEGIRKGTRKNMDDGSKQYFVCKHANKKGWKTCPYQLCVRFNREDESVEVS